MTEVASVSGASASLNESKLYERARSKSTPVKRVTSRYSSREPMPTDLRDFAELNGPRDAKDTKESAADAKEFRDPRSTADLSASSFKKRSRSISKQPNLRPFRSNSLNNSTPLVSQRSLWQQLLRELDFTDTASENSGEHLLNVVRIPMALERVMLLGMSQSIDSFLSAFTILPLRFSLAFYESVTTRRLRRSSDLYKGLMLVITLLLVSRLDISKVYHYIRGQAAMKLYVMFSVLEIADKLCSAVGQDILEYLFYKPHKYPILPLAIAIAYCFVHSFVLLTEIVTLNVAINSYSNALLTLLLSNQFAEIKGAVFKKFDRENLFQLACADITERFQLLIMLLTIGLRNIVEVSNTGIIPTSWAGWNRWLGALFGPAFVVLLSEVCVDWTKHAYIAKFNNISASIYMKFFNVLASDYGADNQMTIRRLGLPIFPLTIVLYRMSLQSYSILAETHRTMTAASSTATTVSAAATSSTSTALEGIDKFLKSTISSSSPFWSLVSFLVFGFLVYLLLLVFKLLLGSILLDVAYKVRFNQATRNSLPSDFIPADNSSLYNAHVNEQTRSILHDGNAPPQPPSLKEKKDDKLSTITRFRMVAKRIW